MIRRRRSGDFAGDVLRGVAWFSPSLAFALFAGAVAYLYLLR